MATKVGVRDFDKIAEQIKLEADDRQKARKDREKQWDEVDAQLRMDKDHAMKIRAKRTDGQMQDREGDWIPAFVLPHQATALEVLTSDARRMMLPESKSWFEAQANMTDDILEKYAEPGLFEGDQQGGTLVTQEDLNAICEAVLQHNHRKYDVGAVLDCLNADAMKYGEFAGRVKEVTGKTYTDDFRGVWNEERKFVALTPASMKTTYPDESVQNVMGEGLAIQPTWIRVYQQRVQDLQIASRKGNSDTRDPIAGGWLKKNVAKLEPVERRKHHIKVIEYEGDLVVDRSRDKIELFNKVITVAVGRDGPTVVRYRDQDTPYRSYVHGVYHYESKTEKVGPLVKAAPLHNAMSEIFNRLVACGILHVEPPLSHSPDDRYFLSQAGPRVFPRAVWPTATGIQVHEIGDPEKMLAVFLAMLRMYEELTGVTAPRTGAQTKSHQTAFAIDQEISRGQIRTVDYVKSAMRGPITNWLYMEWDMLKRTMDTEMIYVPRLQSYLRISADMLPDCIFDVYGAAGPLEEQREEQKRQQSMMAVLQTEPIARQLGAKPLNLDKIRQEMLRDGGWSNAADFFAERIQEQAVAPGGGVAGESAGQPPVGGNIASIG
jgi:hypothetical protein